jgi:RNA polymerase sigma-70 factor (ECF subfamily)
MRSRPTIRRPARTTHDDLELVRRALAGEARALEELTDRLACVPAMLRDRHRRYGSPLKTEELAEVEQDTLVAMWGKLAQFEGRASIETWVYRFTVHELLKAIVRKRRGRFVEGDAALQAHAAPQDDEASEDMAAALDECLRRLGSPSSEVVKLRHFECLSFEDIASRTCEPTSTVKARYYRAMERLRELLDLRLAKEQR